MLRPCQTPDAECDVIVGQESYRSLGVPGGSMSAAHEALVRQAIEVIWNRGDLDAADELFAPHYMNHYGLIARAGDRPIPIHAWQRDVQDCAFGLKRSALQLTVFVPDTTVVPKCTLSIAPRHRLPP